MKIDLLIIITYIALLIWVGYSFNDNKKKEGDASHIPIRLFNRSGEIEWGATRIWSDTVYIANGNGASIDITSAGFTSVRNVQCQALRNTADSSLVPNVAVKSVSTSAVVFNVTRPQVNIVAVGLIGLSIQVGSPIRFTNASDAVTLCIQVTGR